MKQHPSIFTLAASLVCTLILALTACTPQALDELAPGTDGTPVPLTISVTDGGMYSTPDPDAKTRAEERGYQTVFTEGDQIGLYVVKGGAVEKSNLCLTLRGDKWTLPVHTAGIYYTPDKSFYAYYPYKDDSYMEGKVSPGSEDFFETLVNMWQTKNNQSNYADYTASDLMTARGEYSNGTLHFAMEHRMALLIVRFPTTLYKYTEQIDGREIPKSYYRHTVHSSPCLNENPSTERFLFNPTMYQEIVVKYYLNGKVKDYRTRTVDLNLQCGKYTIHKIEGGAVTEVERPLKEGDYYMKDGGILPAKEVTPIMSTNDRMNCLGVVFWVGENEGYHWTLPGDKKGDHLLMRDHPGCVHGMVVALRDASARDVWATGSGANEELYKWAGIFNGFNAGEQADWTAIYASDVISFGYCSSHILKLYSAHHSDTQFPAYKKISSYAALHPTPASSSGWFFPSLGELAMMCYGKAENYAQMNPERRDLLNGLFQKAGGDRLEGRYWSTTNDKENVWSLNFNGNTSYSPLPKSDNYKVRPVLAF